MVFVAKYKDLQIWHKAIEIANLVYELTRYFPNEEKFGLVSQMRRCAVSVSSNIAEGKGRASKAEFVQFLRIARASLYELESQIVISAMQGFISEEQQNVIISKSESLSISINAFISKLNKS